MQVIRNVCVWLFNMSRRCENVSSKEDFCVYRGDETLDNDVKHARNILVIKEIQI